MTFKEASRTLEQRRKGLAYRMWKQANLVGASMGKGFPTKPETACPELYPVKSSMKMPDWLLSKWLKKGGKTR